MTATPIAEIETRAVRPPYAAADDLSPTRQRLAAALRAVQDAGRAAGEARAPITKLSELGMRAATARALADNLRSADVEALAQWLAGGGVGDRPARSAEMVLADYAATEAERDAAAASALIPKLEAEAESKDMAVGVAAARRDDLVWKVIAEEAENVAADLSRRYSAAVGAEARFCGLLEELFALLRFESNTNGGRRNAQLVDGINTTISRLTTMRDAARAVPEIAPSVAAAHRFIDSLRAGNAAAKFEVQ
jgi:hypothetical protein